MMEHADYDEQDVNSAARQGQAWRSPQHRSPTATPERTPLVSQASPATDSPAERPTPAAEGTKQEDPIVTGLWNVWSTVSTQATKLLKDAEQSRAMGRAKELSMEIASRAAEGIEHVMEALDPMGGLGTPPEMKIVVMSVEPAPIRAVQAAADRVFPTTDVDVVGINVSSDVAAQPVGFAAGQRGAENRLLNSKASMAEAPRYAGAIMVSIESFIVEIEGNWYDMACVILRDDAKDLSHVTFSQAVRVPTEYVQKAEAATPSTYGHHSTGLQMTVGEAISGDKTNVPAVDWQGTFTNGHMRKTHLLEHCVAGVMGEYLVELRRRRAAQVTEQPAATP